MFHYLSNIRFEVYVSLNVNENKKEIPADRYVGF